MIDRPEPHEAALPPESYRRLDSLAQAREAIDQAIASARKTLRLFEFDLTDPGYNSPRRAELLRAFLRAGLGDRLQIALHSPEHLQRDCPRLMALLQIHSDRIAIHRTLPDASRVADPFLVADEHAYWHRMHHEHPRLVLASGDRPGTLLLLQRFEQIWNASEPAVSATTLGL